MSIESSQPVAMPIPIAVSARHVHLSLTTIEQLFGKGHRLRVAHGLSQPGQYAAIETVTLRGPRGALGHVRVVGPPRDRDQVELSRSDELALGIDAPLRTSGDLASSAGIILQGPAGTAALDEGVVRPRRHIHMNPEDAARLGVQDGDLVEVAVDSDGRDLTFADIVVRVSQKYRLELHLDTDEANACGINDHGQGTLRGVRSVDREGSAQ
jgi:acetate kinase